MLCTARSKYAEFISQGLLLQQEQYIESTEIPE